MIEERIGTIGRTQGVNDRSRPNARKARAIFHKLPPARVAVARERSLSAAATFEGAAPSATEGTADAGFSASTALLPEGVAASSPAAVSKPGLAGSTLKSLVIGG